MITFFRKIRRKLLAENRVTPYLIYTLGEILLVVIGILIALWINNLNEESKFQKAQMEMLLSFSEDLKADVEAINIHLIEMNEITDVHNLIHQQRKMGR